MTDFDSVIPPGGVGKVKASISSKKFKGPITKSVTVTTNDPAHPKFTLLLKATIAVAIDVRPRDRIYLTGTKGSVEAKELFIVASDGQPFDILKVDQSKADEIGLRFEPAPDKAEKAKDGKIAASRPAASGSVAGGHSAYKLTVSVLPGAGIGRLLDNIKLKTNHATGKEVTLTVNARITGNLVVRPEQLYFRSVGTAANGTFDPRLKKVSLKESKGSGGLKIKGTEVDHPDFTAKSSKKDDGSYEVEVRYTGKEGAGRIKATLVIQTNDSLQPTIEIPLNASF